MRLEVAIQVDVIILPWDFIVIAHVIRLLSDYLLGSWPLNRGLFFDTFGQFGLLWGALKLCWLGPLADSVHYNPFCVFAALGDLAYSWLHLAHRWVLQRSILFHFCLNRGRSSELRLQSADLVVLLHDQSLVALPLECCLLELLLSQRKLVLQGLKLFILFASALLVDALLVLLSLCLSPGFFELTLKFLDALH